jgi:hypothetical protein
VYLDPTKYIRAVEEFFECNIFMFDPNGVAIETRYNNFCVHSNNCKYETTVVLMVHKGTECSPSDVPNCDLIMIDMGGIKEYTYDKDAGNRLLNRLRQYSRIYDGEMFDIRDMYIHHDYQIIDSLGKRRAMIVDDVVIFVSPSVPSTKPIYKRIVRESSLSKVKDWLHVSKSKIERVSIATSTSGTKYLRGLHVRVNDFEGYIEIKPIREGSIEAQWLEKYQFTYDAPVVINNQIQLDKSGRVIRAMPAEGTISKCIKDSKCREIMNTIAQVIYVYNPYSSGIKFEDYVEYLEVNHITMIKDYDAYFK